MEHINLNTFDKYLRRLNKFNKSRSNIIDIALILIISIIAVFLMFEGVTLFGTQHEVSQLSSLKAHNYSRVFHTDSNRDKYRKILDKYHLNNKIGLHTFRLRFYKLKGSNRDYIDDKLPKRTQIYIMMKSIRHGFRAAVSLCSLLIILIITYALSHNSSKLKGNGLNIIGKTCSLQIISAISIYSIILNFYNNAFNEPRFIISTSIFMISIMCVAFIIYTTCSVVSDKMIIHSINRLIILYKKVNKDE